MAVANDLEPATVRAFAARAPPAAPAPSARRGGAAAETGVPGTETGGGGGRTSRGAGAMVVACWGIAVRRAFRFPGRDRSGAGFGWRAAPKKRVSPRVAAAPPAHRRGFLDGRDTRGAPCGRVPRAIGAFRVAARARERWWGAVG